MTEKKAIRIDARGVTTLSSRRVFEVRVGNLVGYVDAAAHVASPQEAPQALFAYGILATGHKLTAVRRAMSDVADFEPADLIDRVGHSGQHFVYVDGSVYSPPDAPAAKVIVPSRKASRRAGTLEGWQNDVAAPLARNPICEFAMAIPFTAALRQYTGRADNFGWLFHGPRGCGKSVLLALAGSSIDMAPGQLADSYVMSFASTTAGIEQEMVRHADHPMLIDELNLYGMNLSPKMRGRALIDLITLLGRGEDRRRFHGQVGSYRFVYAFTGNESLDEIIGGTSQTKVTDSVADRLMSIPLDHRPYSVFAECETAQLDCGDLIAQLMVAQTREHGTAMPAYLQALVSFVARDPSAFRETLEHHLRDFRRAAGAIGRGGEIKRVADAFGLVYAATRLAKHFGVLPDSYDPLKSTLYCYDRYRLAGTTNPNAADTILSLFDHPDTIDLDQTGRLNISKETFSAHLAFKSTKRSGENELLVSAASLERILPRWSDIKKDNHQIARILNGDKTDGTVKRGVRVGEKDRVYCFVKPIV